MKKITTLLAIIFCNIAIAGNAFAASQISATIDKNPVVVNESFILKIIIDDDVNTNALDTSTLLKDFIVGRTSVSSQTSMVNFKTKRTTTWSTLLIAKAAGDFVIPALTIEGLSTQSINVNVLAENDPQADKQQDLFITSDISAHEVYVQQQLTLTVKLHFAAELKRGSLTEPSLNEATITQIGKDKESDTIINGRRYRIIERTYAISPQKSGEFILKSPIFSGEILVPSTRRNNMFSFSETKPVSVIGDELPLTVLPIPNTFQGTWLPSNLLAIHQNWQPEITTFKVGEPITRTITLTAAGLSEEQLPELEMTVPKGLKVYPDQAQLHTGMSSGHLVSQKVRNFAIVASKSGEYQLPEINIPWWNTVTNRYQVATIASQTVTVLPNPDLEITQVITPSEQRKEVSPAKSIIVPTTPWLQWVFLALWLLTALVWFISTKWQRTSTKRPSGKQRPSTDAYVELMAACNKNKGLTALSLIANWLNDLQMQAGLQQTTTLNETLSSIDDKELAQEIDNLQQCYYGKKQKEWRGSQLLKIIKRINKQGISATNLENKKQQQPTLISLNP